MFNSRLYTLKGARWSGILLFVGTPQYPTVISWKEYTQLLMARFGDVCNDPMADLVTLRQKTTVIEYYEQFASI